MKHRARIESWHQVARTYLRRRPGRLELVAELTGYALIVAAAFTVAVGLGLLAAGLALVWLGNANAKES